MLLPQRSRHRATHRNNVGFVRAEEYEKKAKKKLRGCNLFFSVKSYAACLFDKAVVFFNIAKSWDRAGSTYVKIPNCHLKPEDGYSKPTAEAYVNGANFCKKTNSEGCYSFRERRKNRARNKTSEAWCSPNIVLPEDILVEILSRLSLDSLPRFTCVSKQWHRLISTIFVTKKGSSKVLLASYLGTYAFSPESIDQHQQEACKESLLIPWTRSYFRKPARCLGSCNGLLLLGLEYKGLFLWNPLTRFLKKVMAFEPFWMEGSYGLCYDSATDDYKAVIILASVTTFLVVSFKNKSRAVIPFPYKVSKVDWQLDFANEKKILDSGPVVNAKLHWFIAKNEPSGKRPSTHQIIYFDAHVEKFEEVPMPEPKRGDGDIILALGALDRCLCMSRRDCTRYNVEVLVMKEYGVKNSWTSLFVVSDCLGPGPTDGQYLVPLGYMKNGEVLAAVRSCLLLDDPRWLFHVNRWHIRAFNPADNSYRSISKPEELLFRPIVYEESLSAPSCDREDEER